MRIAAHGADTVRPHQHLVRPNDDLFPAEIEAERDRRLGDRFGAVRQEEAQHRQCQVAEFRAIAVLAEPLAGQRRVDAIFQDPLGHRARPPRSPPRPPANRLVQMHEGGRGPPTADLQNMRVEEAPRAGFIKSDLRGPETQSSVDDQLDPTRFRRLRKCARRQTERRVKVVPRRSRNGDSGRLWPLLFSVGA